MPKIEKLLKLMQEREVVKTILRSNQPVEFYFADKVEKGFITSFAQLREVAAEVVPPSHLPQLDNGTFHFQLNSIYGVYDIGVDSFAGDFSLTISPAKKLSENAPPNSPIDPKLHSPTALPCLAPPPQSPVPTPTGGHPVGSASPPHAHPHSAASPMCAVHPQLPAAGSCSYSGKFYCADCLVDVHGKLYGKENLHHVIPNYSQANPNVPNMAYAPIANPNFVQTPNGLVATSDRSKIAAGLLGIFLGWLGVHRFYLGYTTIGAIQLAISLVGWFFFCGISAIPMWIWGFIEGIIIFSGSMDDAEGRPLRP